MSINQILLNHENLIGLAISTIICYFGYSVLKNVDKYIEKEIKLKKENYENYAQQIFRISFNEKYYRKFARIFIPFVGTIFCLGGVLGIISALCKLARKI